MKLPTGLRITAPENLEGDSFSCYFRFSHLEEYEQYLNVLTAAANEGIVAALIEALNGPPADNEETRRE